jgi:hypothetical protein
MALMDKMKAQASQLAQKAQEAGKAGQAKLEDVQAKRRADGLLRDLGAVVFAQKTGKGNDESAGEIDRLVNELKSYETEHGALDQDGSVANDTEDPPEGGFKL